MTNDELWDGAEPPGLSSVLRRARKASDISIRELARRSGVSAGQISRIESGDVIKPELETVRALSRALGVPLVPLLVLADHLGHDELKEFVDARDNTFDRLEAVSLTMQGEMGNEERIFGFRDAAAMIVEQWSKQALAREFGLEDDASDGQLEEIAAVWPGLTDDRKRLVLAFVADQEVLSRLDRMPNPPGRYAPRVELLPVGDTDG